MTMMCPKPIRFLGGTSLFIPLGRALLQKQLQKWPLFEGSFVPAAGLALTLEGSQDISVEAHGRAWLPIAPRPRWWRLETSPRLVRAQLVPVAELQVHLQGAPDEAPQVAYCYPHL